VAGVDAHVAAIVTLFELPDGAMLAGVAVGDVGGGCTCEGFGATVEGGCAFGVGSVGVHGVVSGKEERGSYRASRCVTVGRFFGPTVRRYVWRSTSVMPAPYPA